MNTLGVNEALILASLSSHTHATLAEIAKNVSRDREIDDGTIYIALRRMAKRGFVTANKRAKLCDDDRTRDIGFYDITDDGSSALDSFVRDGITVRSLRAAITAGAGQRRAKGSCGAKTD